MTRDKDFFQTFCTLSQAFSTAATVDELLELIVRSATETMHGKAACLFLADQKQDIFVPTTQFGLSDKYLHANPLKAKKIVEALKKQGHLVFEDAATDPRLENHEAKKAEGIASILTVAVMVDNRPWLRERILSKSFLDMVSGNAILKKSFCLATRSI